MASLEEIFDKLKERAKESGKPASRVLKIKGLKRLVVQINAIPSRDNVRFSMTIHSQRNYKKQIGIVADDAEDLEIIAKFLKKYKDVLDKYIKFNIRREEDEIEIDIEEENENQKKEKKKKNIEEEF